MNDWIVQEKFSSYPIDDDGRRAQIVCGSWQSPMLPYDTAAKIASARNTDVLGTKLQAGWTPAQGYKEHIDAMQELEDLRAWKKEALLVESMWNEQAVGHALGLTLGEAIKPNILGKVLELKGDLQLLRSVLTGIRDVLSKQGFHGTVTAIDTILELRGLK